MIVNFECKTSSIENLEEIERKVYIAGADILRKEVNENNGKFVGTIEISSYRGSLYKEIKVLGLADIDLSITGGHKDKKDKYVGRRR